MPFLGLGFGSGLAPFAPGTFGTVAAIPVYLLLSLGGQTVYLAGLILVLVGGISICDSTAKTLNSHDHPAIVWDEIAGFLVTMTVVSVSTVNVIVGFILFRFFDIIKPWPIKWVDRRIHGGLGIMLDDILAGAIAGILLFLINLWNPAGLFSV
jgi:phosphatidylglycerophosphatase A